jgi:hypothetical protein
VAPLTAYAGHVTGEASNITLAKLARVSYRPPVIPVMAAFDVLVALVGPIWAVIGRFMARPQVNAEGTNYAGAAFNAVGIAFMAIFMIPLALALWAAAFGTIAQRTWGWYASLGVIVAVFLGIFTGFLSVGLLRYPILIANIILAILWLQHSVREWYGLA